MWSEYEDTSIEPRLRAIELLHQVADNLDPEVVAHLDEGENTHDDDGDDRDRMSSHLMLLADIAGSATPPALLDGLLPIDFPDPEIRAAYRLLLNHDLDLARARAYASHPDVAGVLESVLIHATIRAEHDTPPRDPTRWFGLLWNRRQHLLEADRLRSVARRILESGADEWAALLEANRAIDQAHDRIGLGLKGDSVPPDGLPSFIQTARGRLVGGEAEETVALEDAAIAEVVVDLVEVADRRVLMAVPWIRSSDLTARLLDACRDRAAHGVRILLVTRPVKSTVQYARAAADERTVKRSLASAGVEIAWHRRLHDKVFVIDDAVICGSQNLTIGDIKQNPNSAIGTVSSGVVEQFATRIERLAEQADTYPGEPRVPMAKIPVFAYDAWTGYTHRLAIGGDEDIGALEGGGEAPADCGEVACVDSVSFIWSFSSGERCLACRQPMA